MLPCIDGIDAAIERAKAYADAGADLIFTEALATEADFEKFRAAVDTPLLANMTEFGKSNLISAKTLEEIGFNAVIYPVTTLRLAMFAIEKGLREIFRGGHARRTARRNAASQQVVRDSRVRALQRIRQWHFQFQLGGE